MSSDVTVENNDTRDTFEKYRDVLLEQYKKGNIVYSSIEGPMVAEINHFIRQPVEGILYDLNRLEEVVLSYIKERKWVNDFAVAKTIRKLKEQSNLPRGKPPWLLKESHKVTRPPTGGKVVSKR